MQACFFLFNATIDCYFNHKKTPLPLFKINEYSDKRVLKDIN